MKKKIIFGLLFAAVVGMMLTGCGTAYYENVSYYDPNWLTDGRIMAVKSVEKHRSEGIAGYGRDILAFSGQYIVSMKDDGGDERTIYGGEGKDIGIPVASPLGNYIAYRSGQYIKIITADGSKDVKTIDCGESPQSIDWSPDETRMVFSGYYSHNLNVLNISNEVITKIATSAEVVAWRIGDTIAYDGDWVNVINIDGTNRNTIIQSSWLPQKYSSDEIIYQGASLNVYKIKSDGTMNTILFSNYNKSTLKLSFNNTKIVGGDLDQHVIAGVWVVNIDGINLIKLRD